MIVKLESKLAELTEPRKISQGRPASEKVFGHADMRLERGQDSVVARFQERLVFGGGTENGHAGDLPGAEKFDLFSAARLRVRNGPLFGRPSGDISLIFRIPPPIKKKRFDRPFVGKVFQKIANKGDSLIFGNDGSFPMPALKIISQGRRFASKCSVRVLKNRDQIRPQVLGLFPQRLGHDDPIERNSPVP